VLEGNGVDSMYNTPWFQEQIERFGMGPQGKFSPFPPPTALAYVPVAAFDPLTALRIVTATNIIFLFLSILLLRNILQCEPWDAVLVVLVAGSGLINCFRFGQIYIALSLSIIAGFYFYRTQKPVLAGICFGLFIPIKYFAIVLVLFFALKKQWRLVVASMVTVSVIAGISIMTLGWEIHSQFLTTEAPAHLASNLELQSPFSFTFQSWDSLFRTLFVLDSQSNANPFVDSYPIYIGLKILTASSIVLFTTWIAYKSTRRKDDRFLEDLTISIIMIGGLLVSPASATYHFLLLWLPAGLMLRFLWFTGKKIGFFLFLGLYGIIGFIPYSFFGGFNGKGVLTLLAYPRLIILSFLYILTAKWTLSYNEAVNGDGSSGVNIFK